MRYLRLDSGLCTSFGRFRRNDGSVRDASDLPATCRDSSVREVAEQAVYPQLEEALVDRKSVV